MPASFGGASWACAGVTIASARTEPSSSLIDECLRDPDSYRWPRPVASSCLVVTGPMPHDPHDRFLVFRAAHSGGRTRVEDEAPRFHAHHLARVVDVGLGAKRHPPRPLDER